MRVQAMAGHLIRRLNQRSTQIFTKRMQQAGLDLTSVQFAALDAIIAHPGIDQAGVAARIAYDRATIGGVIDRLVQKGYVARRVSASDRRAREIEITAEGRSVFDAAYPEIERLQDDILTGLTTEERQTFLTLARKLIDAEAESPTPST